MRLMVVASAIAMTAGTTCYEQAPFDCPEGTFCSSWTDGCNECGCDAADSPSSFCTMMMCECYNDNSCVPSCNDNDACVPRTTVDATDSPNTVDTTETDNTEETNTGDETATQTEGTTCYEQAPFDCPEGTFCASWNDGCNECGCGSGDAMFAACTAMMCPCLEDNSCIPSCNDNDQCVPRTAGGTEPVDNTDETVSATAGDVETATSCYEQAPFDCPEGTFCASWNDGCNECTCGSGDAMFAACTAMMCPCLEDGSCVPSCNDNDQCVPKDSILPVSSETTTSTEEPVSSESTTNTEAPVSSESTANTKEPLSTTGDAAIRDNENATELVEDTLDEDTEAPLPHPFICPEGTTCTEWSDGCNNCRSTVRGNFLAACTEKYCPCYDDNSCVPVCMDNDLCSPANNIVNPATPTSDAVSVVTTSWFPALLLLVVGL